MLVEFVFTALVRHNAMSECHAKHRRIIKLKGIGSPFWQDENDGSTSEMYHSFSEQKQVSSPPVPTTFSL